MAEINPDIFLQIYSQFNSPITEFDCGLKCAPYNENRIPFCCDTKHAIPSAYQEEWDYLQNNTDLWHLWEGATEQDKKRIDRQKPINHVLVECKGHLDCQRNFRAITCRAFPFFPYIDKQNSFIGLSYYSDYTERCWIISNLDKVTPTYIKEFCRTFDSIFGLMPEEKELFRYHSIITRRVYGRRKRAITLLHRNGFCYKITPSNGRLRRIDINRLPGYDPYKTCKYLPFSDEVS